MKPTDLARIGAGFSDPALGSQAVFRAALQALSHPGRLVDLKHDAQVPSRGHAAAAALLLALLDPDCGLWLSPSLVDSDAAAWLRFHSGCALVSEPARAQFAWVAANDAMPSLGRFANGSDAAPDQSTTCVLDVPALAEGTQGTPGTQDDGDAAAWRLEGPGIRDACRLKVDGWAPGAARALVEQRAASQAAFPRGIDMFLATEHQIVGLPRTTRIALGA